MTIQPSLILRIMAVAFLVIGGIIFAGALKPSGEWTRTRARIVHYNMVDATNKVQPIVSFEKDGKTVEALCSWVSMDHLPGKAGDEVEIAWREEGFLGGRTIKATLDVDHPARSRSARGLLAGIVFLLAGAALCIASMAFAGRGL